MSIMKDEEIEKLNLLFGDRYESLRSEMWNRLKPKDHSGPFNRKLEEAWADCLNGLDCTVLDPSDILEDFRDIANKSVQGRVCLGPWENDEYILVPLELAKKALILGGLPDQWFPEEAAG